MSKAKSLVKNYLLIFIGTTLFCFSTTYFILPANIYNGGVLGTSQVIQALIRDVLLLNLPAGIEFVGIINLLFNIPLFVLAYKSISKTFLLKTFYCVGIQTFLFTLFPPLQSPIVDDTLTSGIIGGTMAGVGLGIVLFAGASTGGVDILGMFFTLKYKNFSVGNFAIIYNTLLYSVCCIIFDISIAIYSVITIFVTSIIADKFHAQNIRIMAIIITKNKELSKKIISQMHRGVTMWNGKGVYTMNDNQILLTVISKYEISSIKSLVKSHDENAFLILSEGLEVMGNYEKRISA